MHTQKQAHVHTHASTRARTHAQTHTRASTHARTHARTTRTNAQMHARMHTCAHTHGQVNRARQLAEAEVARYAARHGPCLDDADGQSSRSAAAATTREAPPERAGTAAGMLPAAAGTGEFRFEDFKGLVLGALKAGAPGAESATRASRPMTLDDETPVHLRAHRELLEGDTPTPYRGLQCVPDSWEDSELLDDFVEASRPQAAAEEGALPVHDLSLLLGPTPEVAARPRSLGLRPRL